MPATPTILDIAFLKLNELTGDEKVRIEETVKKGLAIVVGKAEKAKNIARTIDSNPGQIVVIKTGNTIDGILSPAAVCERVFTQKKIDIGSFSETVEALEKDPAEIARGFHHEWLNATRPQLYYCSAGEHVVDRLPCPISHRKTNTDTGANSAGA